MRRFTYGFFALIIIYTSACTVQKNPISGKKRAYGYSWSEELKIGRDADQQIISQYGLYDNPELLKYITDLGQEIVAESHFNRASTPKMYVNTEFTFRLLDSPVVNAFALPGGYVYITRGLLAHLNNEAQLAVVLGHEVVHIIARHASQRALKQKAGQIALISTAVVGESIFGVSGKSIIDLGGSAAQLLLLKYGRDDETESDRVGVEYAALLGYKTSEAALFFNSLSRISDNSGGRIPSHLSSHPDPGDREKNMLKLQQKWEGKGYSLNQVNEVDYLKRINGVIVGENPRHGFVENGVFYHPDMAFKFSFNPSWNIQNEPSRVILYDENQKAISLFSPVDGTSDVKTAVYQIVQQQGFTILSEEAKNINGFDAYFAESSVTTQNGSLYMYATAINYKSTLFRFISYTSLSDKELFQNDLQLPAISFETITDKRILGIKPIRLSLYRTSKEGKLSDFISNKPDEIDIETIAIWNQINLNDTIPTGTLLKLPVRK